MNYLISIKTAFLLFPFIALFFTIPFILSQYHKYGSIHWFRSLIIYTFILYLIVIYFLVILPLPKFEEVSLNPGPYFNIVPFKFIGDFIRETSFVLSDPKTYLKALTEPCFYVVIFNIFMTVPFGMYLRYYFKCSFKTTVLYTFFLSLFFEFTQGTALYFIYPNPYRLCDIDDLIENTLGGMLGYILMGLILKYLPTRDEIDKESLKKGSEVSGLRRITVFCLDLTLYFLITIISFFFSPQGYIYTFLIYFILIPLLLSNKTLGMKFLNVKMEYHKHPFLKNIFRSLFLVVYYLLIPIWILIGNNIGISILNLEKYKVFCYLIVLFLILIFYLINLLIILITKRIYYDSLFTFEFVSTINIEEQA